MSIKQKHYVYVDSRQRLSGTDSNFTYALNLPADEEYDRVVVLNALIPKSYYLVQTGKNTFQLIEGTSTVTITVPVGDYVLQAWQSTLQTLLNTYSPHSWTYTITFPNSAAGANTGKLTFNVTGNGSVQPALKIANNFFE